EAVTRFRVLGYFGHPDSDRCKNSTSCSSSCTSCSSYTLVQVQIDHGRQHQIRLHFASMGHPLVSDPKYNASKIREDGEVCPRLFLHACFLRCVMPPSEDAEEEPYTIACRLPPELKHTLCSTLTWRKELAGKLLPEAHCLCECLMGSECMSGDGSLDDLHESRLAVRRRDDFLHRFGFSDRERTEVTRILSQLPTSKQRCTALQQF
ncbi:unnamed protein product, partial [Prorocentrum cordatum]